MYRSYKYFGLILITSLIFSACKKKSEDTPPVEDKPYVEEPDTDTPKLGQLCVEGAMAPAECIVESTSSFTYDQEFGGRDDVGSSLLFNAPSSLSQTIPSGYYDSAKTARIEDTDLVGANIVKGVNIFGVNGELEAVSPANCAIDGSTDAYVNPGLCSLTVSKYVYQNEYDGRSTTCTIEESGVFGSRLTGPCWLTTARHLNQQQVDFQACAQNSQITNTCVMSSGGYNYSQIYGGRGAACSLGRKLTEPCWVAESGYVLNTIRYCSDENGEGYNNRICVPTKVGNYVYINKYGGRDVNCREDDAQRCYFNDATKAQADANLVAAHIKAGVNIFGVDGAFISEGFSWGSGAHRAPTAEQMVYQNPPGVTATRIAESSLGATAPPTGYSLVPQFSFGNNSDILDSGQFVDRGMWGSTACGQSNGSVDSRIADCAATLTPSGSTTWDGKTKGNAGQGEWKLVSRKAANQEVWKDMSTGLLWSSRVNTSSGINWCKASGNSNSDKIDEAYRENVSGGYCNDDLYQGNGSTNPISACLEGFGGYQTDSQLKGFFSTGTDQDGKAGLKTLPAAQKANGRVFWRIPTAYDFMLANHNGIRFVLPDMATETEEWTGTTLSTDVDKAWSFNSKNGRRRSLSKTSNIAARCVGR
jgi:hypothetical protein